MVCLNTKNYPIGEKFIIRIKLGKHFLTAAKLCLKKKKKDKTQSILKFVLVVCILSGDGTRL